MMPDDAWDQFERLIDDVKCLYRLGEAAEASDDRRGSLTAWRGCIILAVAAVDAYVHQRAISAFESCMTRDAAGDITRDETGNPTLEPDSADRIAAYIRQSRSVLEARYSQHSLTPYLRYHVSLKTLVSVEAIEKVLLSSGADPAAVGRRVGEARGERESRIQNRLTLLADRRNQIAHEGDWNTTSWTSREISSVHASEAIECATAVAGGLREHWDHHAMVQ